MTDQHPQAFGRRIHRLIFASRQRLSGTPPVDEELAAIRESSGRNNADADLTGVLLAHGDWFLQAIEGSRESVLMAYGRIVDDPRHGEAKVLGSGPVESRAFQAWCVCARVFGAADAAILEALERRGPFDAGRLTDRSALKLLQGIEAIKLRAAAAA
jgi:hypothetical protein